MPHPILGVNVVFCPLATTRRGRDFKTIVEARAEAAIILGEAVKPGTPQAKLVDEPVEVGLVQAAQVIINSNAPQLVYEHLVDLYHRQPILATRSSTSIAQQAYSIHKVVSDITGTTRMAIIRAVIAGERDPQILAAKKHYRAKRSEAEIAAALNGDYRSEHIFVLQQELQLYDVYQTQIAACDRQIQECLAQFSDKVNLNESPLPPSKHPRHKPQGNEPDA